MKGVIRSHKSKKDRQYNSKKKITNNDLQHNTKKVKNLATLKTGGELMCSARVPPLVTLVALLLNDINIIRYGNRVGHQY